MNGPMLFHGLHTNLWSSRTRLKCGSCNFKIALSSEQLESGSITDCRASFTARAGNLGPAGRIRSVAALPNCSNCMARLVALYFMNLPSLQILVLNTYEEVLTRNSTDAINVLFVTFCAFVMNCDIQELI